jgi:dipeptidyl-peptidase-3
VVLLQTSPESPSIFRLLLRLTRAQDTASLRAAAIAAGLDDQQVSAFFVYCSGFLSNMGNYKGFGDSKFVPNLTVEALDKLVKASEAYKADQGVVGGLWEEVKGPMYSLKDLEKQLGLGKKGITKYFTPNCDLEDSELVNRFFKTKSLEGYINRVIKTVEGGKTCYEIRNAGVADTVQIEEDFEGCKMKVTTGDYQGLLDRVAINLEEAAKHSANSDEANMLKEYAASFKEGSLDKHKEGSRYWIKNKGPLVETYIGFIETYRDPAGMRGEFEGFVAMVNKQMSEKFQV